MQTAAFDAEVHHAFIDQLRRTGCAPSRHDNTSVASVLELRRSQ